MASAGEAAHPADVERLMKYWALGAGAANIGWSTAGDFDRCRAELGRFVPDRMLAGLCARLHHRATGAWPGHAPGEQAGH